MKPKTYKKSVVRHRREAKLRADLLNTKIETLKLLPIKEAIKALYRDNLLEAAYVLRHAFNLTHEQVYSYLKGGILK